MIPYHYSVVQCRDAAVTGEARNVALLVVSPAKRKAWLRRGQLKPRAHLVGDDAAFVRAMLDLLQDEATQVAREGDAAVVHDWLRSRARASEDTLSLSAPAMGIAHDLDAEVRRLAVSYLGASRGGGRSAAQKLRLAALRRHGLEDVFAPRAIETGPATWRFDAVTDLAGHPLVFNALQFTQGTPEGVIEGAWRNVGRAQEVNHYLPGAQWLTIARGPEAGPTGRAFTRALEVMQDGDLNVIDSTEASVEAALSRFGLVQRRGAVEAK